MAKFDILVNVLRELHIAGVLPQCILVGSWCLEFYRNMYDNPHSIPATRTLDANFFLPRRASFPHPVNVCSIMENLDFVTRQEYPSGLIRFVHADLDVEFLTNPGRDTRNIHHFKQLGIVAEELNFMDIPQQYSTTTVYEGIPIRLPEPEAFTLHKLIIAPLRKNPEKRDKDIEAVRGLFIFFDEHPEHVCRLHEIYEEFPKGWKKRIDSSLSEFGMRMPDFS